MPTIKQIVEQTDTWQGRAFDLSIQGLIVLSLISFSIETLPDLSERVMGWLRVVEIVTVAVFTIEYLLRVTLATHRARFIFSFFGVIDLLAILPFYISTGVDLRSLRAFRLLRLIRILKLARYNAAARRFRRAFAIAREEFILFGFLAVVLLYLTAAGIWYFEREAQPEAFASVFHSLWWAIVTLTTVGYGDVYPVTVGGRVFTGLILIIGLGIVAVPTGVLASALDKARSMEDAER